MSAQARQCMNITRRQLLYYGGSATLLSLVPMQGICAAIKRPIQTKSLWLYNTHTGESVKEIYWAQGKYIPSAQKRLSYLLRDHRVNEVKLIQTSLFDLIFQLQQLLGYKKPFDVISGYRSARTNAKLRRIGGGGVAKNSFHVKGMAMDIRLRGLSLDRARKAGIFLAKGGVGYYPSSNFVHLDVRGKPTSWCGV